MMSENEKLIIVDSNDIPIGYEDKITTHSYGLLHRAFSIFIYDPNRKRMLIQKRAMCKYHSGGLWSNSCCSHMLLGKSEIEVIKDSLQRELGIRNTFINSIKLGENLFFCGKFSYCVDYENLSENEIDNVFLIHMNSNQEVSINKSEVETYQWIDIDKLIKWKEDHITNFSAWFSQALELVLIKLKMR